MRTYIWRRLKVITLFFHIIFFTQLIFVIDSDSDIEVGDFIPDVGAEETVVSPDIIQQHIVGKLEAPKNQKFEDLATHIYLPGLRS